MWKQVVLVLLGVAALVFTLPVHEANGTPFASPAFEQLWIQHQRAQLDLWGEIPLAWRIEPYADSPGGRRLVQYFDRGRMELTTLASVNRTSVTQGRLAWELTTGNIAIGSDLFIRRPPPDLPIDGGSTDPRVPTYATLAALVSEPAPDRTVTSQAIDSWITADGSREHATPPAPVRSSRYIATTRHNLPDVTVSLFDRSPLGPNAWIEVFGYPISEPFWAYYRRGETALPSLIQVFERRILVYTPSLPADQRFTLVNTGRHYYRWRYGADPSRLWPDPLPGTPVSIQVPPHFRAGLFLEGVRDPVDLALAPDGNLLVLTSNGTVLLVTAEDASGRASRLTTFASGLVVPRGIATAGPWVYVTDDQGLVRLRDDDGDGIADRTQRLPLAFRPLPGPAGAPVTDARGQVYLAGLAKDGSSAPYLYLITEGHSVPLGPAPTSLVRLFTWGELLFALVQTEEGRVHVVRLDFGSRTVVAEPFLDFPAGFIPGGGLAYTTQLWADPIPGTLFFWGTRETAGTLLRAVPGSDGQGAPTSPFAQGFRYPVAMTVGLDGTLYVADAGTGQLIKIVPTRRQAQ
ncbi:hypothetical protein OO015_10270 [Thermomicrobium sp. 4228-Ro]|uniref:DUF7133 domain-containing protein n=1 Tax=Thermomicrobium sp. 4228-Ro TaxID=2993937 RepID=UPI0022488097|nr:hypothetical protein [Thermomicrobium sp. 4228-Ro]MCX2727872.1 hypothetical protein [Thermomicrobium sp. 4228-Ro]